MNNIFNNYDYQVGERVRIRAKEDIPEDCYHGWNALMNQWCGQEFTISYISKGNLFNAKDVEFYAMPREMLLWEWSTDMIEPAVVPIQESELLDLLGI